MIEIRLRSKITPKEFIDKINELINEYPFGVIWKIDNEGDYYLEDWQYKAWMRCKVDETNKSLVRFCIIKGRDTTLTKRMYAENHACFLQMLLNHFDNLIKSVKVSPLLSKYDNN